MGKINAYLPDDLEAEAREVGVEWSPVFQEAVRREVSLLRRLAHAETSKKDIAARLLRSKRSENQENFDDGQAAGARWAEVDASFSDLDRLSGYFDRPLWNITDLEQFPTIRSFLFSWALSQGYQDADPDWFTSLESGNAFDRGFVAGAKQVYEAVRDLLDEES